MVFRSLCVMLLFAFCHPGFAHKASDSYLTLNVSATEIDGRWDIALRDLDYAIGLDANDDGAISWGELRSKREQVIRYVFTHLQITGGGLPACGITPTDYLVDTHTDGTYSVMLFKADCGVPVTAIGIDYSLFFDLDPQHRGLLRVEYRQATHTAVLSPNQNQQRIELAEVKPGTAFRQYLHEGVWHIWVGYDHILFLLSLLLPAVFYREARHWHPAPRFRPVLIEVVKIVTAFTIAHSITLSLATLDIISLPSRWVESAIAASVVVAALNNLVPVVINKLWLVAFGFGLIHGLGFANVLKDLGLPQNLLVWTLLAFNVGVELGQLAIVSAFLPIAFWSRRTRWYRVLCFSLGSVVIALLAGLWLVERAFDIKLISTP